MGFYCIILYIIQNKVLVSGKLAMRWLHHLLMKQIPRDIKHYGNTQVGIASSYSFNKR